MDKLQTYLKQHETAMNTDLPGEKVWEHIQLHTAGPVRKKMKVLNFRYAAAACVLLAIALVIFLSKKDHPPIAKADKNISVKENKINDTLSPLKQNTEVRDEEIAIVTPSPVNKIKSVEKHKPAPVQEPALMISKSYNQLINFQLKKLRNTPVFAEGPDYFTDFKVQIKQIDKDESAILDDITKYGLKDELLEQLINIYQQKLSLLKTLQAEINKMNNKVREKQGPSVKLSPHHLDI